MMIIDWRKQMKETIRFSLKSFFAGVLGTLGALSVLAVVAAILFGIFGNQLRTLLPASQPSSADNDSPVPMSQDADDPDGTPGQGIYDFLITIPDRLKQSVR